jgi:cyclase
MGAGEILVTSVDQEGTRRGFDHDLFRAVRERVSIPVIGCGGAGTAAHVADAVTEDGLDAVACASLFHYEDITVPALKAALAGSGIPVRKVMSAA